MDLKDLDALKARIFQDIIFAPGPQQRMRRGPTGSRAGSRTRAVASAWGLHIALGAALTSRRGDYRLAIRIQDENIGVDDLRIQWMRKMAHDEVDIAHIGYPRPQVALGAPATHTPLRVGGSIGCEHGAAGTIGLFLKSLDGCHRFAVSNHHALACMSDAPNGATIIAPGHRAMGAAARAVGTYLNGIAPSPKRSTTSISELSS